MGKVASSVDNALTESFWSTVQRELLDRHDWDTRVDLAAAIFEWIEGWHKPAAGTPPSAISHRQSSKPFTPQPTRRHNQHKINVREAGSDSRQVFAHLNLT